VPRKYENMNCGHFVCVPGASLGDKLATMWRMWVKVDVRIQTIFIKKIELCTLIEF